MKRKRIGKEIELVFVCALCAAALLTGCGGKTEDSGSEEPVLETEETQPVVEEAAGGDTAAETEQEIPEEPSVVIDSEETEVTDEAGTVLLTKKVNAVSVTIPGNEEAEKAVNQFFADLQTSFEDTAAQYEDMARDDLALRDTEELMEGWSGYELGREYSVMRADRQMISIVENSYEYTGGAHPNSVQVAYNFDTGTGERLMLEDVASDLDEIRTETVKYLGETLPESEYASELFDDYANHLEDILTDSTWYTDEKGFHIICNEYIITPHSAGILDFVLPYGDVDVVAEKYIPVSDGDSSADTTNDQSASQQSTGD